jgi:hypothetical protein
MLLVDDRANAEHVVKEGLEVNGMLHEQFREQRSRLHNALAVFLASKIGQKRVGSDSLSGGALCLL